MEKPWENDDLYGKSPCFMGKSIISMVIFNSYVKLPKGIDGYLLDIYIYMGLPINNRYFMGIHFFV